MNSAQAGGTADPSKPSLERLRWQCRRGMLELDLLLSTFLEQAYSSLPIQEQQRFQWLIDQPDPLLLAWFVGEESPGNEALEQLIERVRQITSADSQLQLDKRPGNP